MVEKRKIQKSPIKEIRVADQQNLDLKNLKFSKENSTADQAFFIQDSQTPRGKYDCRTSEEDSVYEQDKDFESIGYENEIADFDQVQQSYMIKDQQQLLIPDDETPHGQSMDENIGLEDGYDAQIRPHMQSHNQAEYPLTTQPFKPIINSSGTANNLHHHGGGTNAAIIQMIQDHGSSFEVHHNKQGVFSAKAVRTGDTATLSLPVDQNIAPTLHASQSPLPQAQKHIGTQQQKTSGKVSANAYKNNQLQSSSSKLDKSQQIRNSYNKFMAGQQSSANVPGGNMTSLQQRPAAVANQPAFILSGGGQSAVISHAAAGAEAAVITQTSAYSRPNRRTNGKLKNTTGAAAIRSKTMKPLANFGSSNNQAAAVKNNQSSNTQLVGSMTANTKTVDLLVIGAGPASLGFLVSAVKQQRFGELLQDEGIAILDNGISFGGGMLCNYGINSNTSANSFLKCIFRRAKEKNNAGLQPPGLALTAATQHNGQPQTSANHNNNNVQSKDTTTKPQKRRQKSVCKERQSQHTKQGGQGIVDISAKSRERQMSPIAHHKWVTSSNRNVNSTTVQPPRQVKDNIQLNANNNLSNIAQCQQSVQKQPKQQNSDKKLQLESECKPTTELKKQDTINACQEHQRQQLLQLQLENGVIGQPQDPDMDDDIPQCQTSSNERQNEVVSDQEPEPSKLEQEEAQNNIINKKTTTETELNQNLTSQALLEQTNLIEAPQNIQSTNEQSQVKKAVRRRKSRDESSIPGRNSKKQQQTSLNRNQALKVTGVKQTFNKAGQQVNQTSLSIYAHGSQSQNNGPTAKSLYNQVKSKTGEPINEAKTWTQDDVLTPFKDIFPSNISQLFRRLAKSIVPLSLVGHLLNYVGNHLLHYAYKSTGKRIYMPKHKAMSIHLMGNGDIVTQVLKTEFTILTDPTKSPASFSVVEGKQSIVYFRSKAVVIAGGAQQGIDQRITQEWFPDLDPQRLIASDAFLKKAEFLSQIRRLKQLSAERKASGEGGKRPKIVIIGGSHSGFSCAWMLLNGPAMYNRCYKTLNEQHQQKSSSEAVGGKDNVAMPASSNNTSAKIPYAYRKSLKNCIPCCTCGNSILIASQKLAAQKEGGNTQNQRYLEELRSQSKAGSRVPRGLSVATRELSPVTKNGRHLSKTIKQRKDLVSLKQHVLSQDVKLVQSALSPESKPAKAIIEQQQNNNEQADTALTTCSCLCKCLGYFKYDEWPNCDSEENSLELPEFDEAAIKILYRDRIKVFFKTTKDAQDAGYQDFDVSQRPTKKKDSYVYSFTGLRGDAKQLYIDVMSGQEKRVAFVKAETPELQREHVEQADLVIWACGYQSNAIKIHDVSKKELVLSQKVPGTQYDVDGKNRVMLADGNVLNKVFACGVGFPVRTKDGGAGNLDSNKNPRADSFSLYMHTVGEVLLKSLLPKKKIAAKVSHKEAVNPYLKAATYEQIMKDKQHKNKKPLLQQVSTKKEKSSTKIGQLTNPGSRIHQKGSLPVDMTVDQQVFLQQETTNVYTSYLQTVKPGSKINVKVNKPSGLNLDLEDLSGFGVINTHALKTNCFSYRAEQEQIQVVPSDATAMQKTGFAEAILKSCQETTSSVNGGESNKVESAVLKFPEIKRDAPLINSMPDQNSKQYVSLNQKSLSSLSNLDQHHNQPASLMTRNNDQVMSMEDLNDRDNSLSNHVLPSYLPAQQIEISAKPQPQPQQQQQLLESSHAIFDSNKSLDRSLLVTSTSRNNQVLTPSITGKSPLLLQKKQQMIIQKTKDPLSSHAILQQTNQQIMGQHNVATMSNLKPTKNSKQSKGNNNSAAAAKQGSNGIAGTSANQMTKPSGKSIHHNHHHHHHHAQDLFKKHSQIYTAVDQSPYMQFGVQHAHGGSGAASHHNHHGDKSNNNNRNHNASKTSKTGGGGGAGKKRNHQDQGYNSAVKESSNTDKLLLGGNGKQSTTGSRHGGHHPSHGKESISNIIHQNQKAFSERESNLHARYKGGATTNTLQHLQKQSQHGNHQNDSAAVVVRKEPITSLEMASDANKNNSGLQNFALAYPQASDGDGLIASSLVANTTKVFNHVDHQVHAASAAQSSSEIREAFGHHKSQQHHTSGNNNQGIYSVKSLVSNSELFPPIANKGHQDCSMNSTVSGGSKANNKHKRIVSSSTTTQNNHHHHQVQQQNNESVRSLQHMSSQQVVASTSQQNIALSSLKHRNTSISAQKAAAVLSQQQKGLVYTPAVNSNTTVGSRMRQHHNTAASGGYMVAGGRTAAQNSAATVSLQSKSANPAVTSSSTSVQAASKSYHKRSGSNQTRSSHVTKKKTSTLLNNDKGISHLPPQTTTLSQNGLLIPVINASDKNANRKMVDVPENEEANYTTVVQSRLTSPKPQPDLNGMYAQDISLRLPPNSDPTFVYMDDAEHLDDDEDEEQLDDPLLQPESSRTTVVEVIPDEQLSQENLLEPNIIASKYPTPVPKIISGGTGSGGNNHFKNAKKQSQNSTSTVAGAYGEMVATLQSRTAAKTPHLRQPSEFQHPKRGDTDHLGNSSMSGHLTTNQTTDRKDSSMEKIPKHLQQQKSLGKKVDQAVNHHRQQHNNKAHQQRNNNNKSPTPHKASVSGKFSSSMPSAQANLQRSARRHGGAISATDLQGVDKTPRGTGAKGRQSIGASSSKRPLNSVGLFDKFIGDAKEATSTVNNHHYQVVQPYLEHHHQAQANGPSNTAAAAAAVTTTASHQSTSSKRPSETKKVSSVAAQKASQKQRQATLQQQQLDSSSQSNVGSRVNKQQVNKHQQQVVREAADISPAKQPNNAATTSDDMVADKTTQQLLSDPPVVAERMQQFTPDGDTAILDLSMTKKQISSFSAASRVVSNNDDCVSKTTSKANPEQSEWQVNQNSKKQTNDGYKKVSAAAGGFFVHKTIRDLAIGTQPDDQLILDAKSLEDQQLADVCDQSTMQTQIKAIKKVVHSKVANLSPVLKKRGQSKAAGGGVHNSRTMMQGKEVGNQLNTSKYRSPIRTTLKSASTSTAAKDAGTGARQTAIVGKEQNQIITTAYGRDALPSFQQPSTHHAGSGGSTNLRHSNTLRAATNNQAQHVLATNLRSPKSGVRKSQNQQHQQQSSLPQSEYAAAQRQLLRPESSQKDNSNNKTALGLTNGQNQVVSHVQMKKEISAYAVRNQKK